MSGDFQVRKDIDRFNRFLEDLRYNMGIDIDNATESLNNIINEKEAEFKASYYDQSQTYSKSEVYNKDEVDRLLDNMSAAINDLDRRVTALEEAMQNANQ